MGLYDQQIPIIPLKTKALLNNYSVKEKNVLTKKYVYWQSTIDIWTSIC